MSEEFGWDKDLTKKVWCFGPDTMGPNMLIDVTKGVQASTRGGGGCFLRIWGPFAQARLGCGPPCLVPRS